MFHAVAVLIFGHELVIIFIVCGSRRNQGISEAHDGLLWCAPRTKCGATRFLDSWSPLTSAHSNPCSSLGVSSQLRPVEGDATLLLGLSDE